MKKSKKIAKNMSKSADIYQRGYNLDLKKLLGEYFIKAYNLPEKANAEIVYKDAMDFVISDRFDVIAKYLYIKSLDLNYDTDFFFNLYKESLNAFSLGGFSEGGTDKKNNFEDFLRIFKELYQSLKDKGMDEKKSLIPVMNGNLIIDGAHRVAISAYFNQKMPCILFDGNGFKYNPLFFRERGLSQEMTEYALMEHINLTKETDIHVAVFWPIGTLNRENLQKGLSHLAKRVNIIYWGEYGATYKLCRNLAILSYLGEDWIGSEENNFMGGDLHAEGTFYAHKSIVAVYFKHEDLDEVLKIKEEVRDILGLQKRSCHMTDSSEEAKRLSRALLTKNSRYFLSYGKPGFIKDILKNLKAMQQKLDSLGVPREDYIFDTGSVMALFGIRIANDVDILIREKHLKTLTENHIDTHNEYISYYEKTLDELIMNPENYFYVNDMKCLTLENILKLKYNRYNKPYQDAIKDISDFRLIESFLMNHR